MTADHDLPASADDPLGLESLWKLVEQTPGEPAADPLLGTTVGDVEIVRMIAEGGMGRVYEGWQNAPRRAVAVKVLRPGPTARATVRRFLQEAQLLGQLRHPGLCQVHAAGTFEFAGAQLPYFVMELVDGGLPLTDHVRRHRLSIADRLKLFTQVCDAVAHAHAHGVIHRDLKPGNILVDATGYPRVIDFGIARGDTTASDLTALTMTGAGHLLGTIQYMSPEQVDGIGAPVDARSDVYALGLLLHEVLVGSPPYELAGAALLEAVRIIRDVRPRPIPASITGAAGVSLVIDRCLEKDPSRRYANAGELVVDLHRRSIPGRTHIADRGRLLVRDIARSPRRATIATTAAIALAAFSVFLVSRRDEADFLARHKPQEFVPQAPSPSGDVLLAHATLPFRFSFTSVLDEHADHYLVSATNVVTWNDPREDLQVNYLGPETNDVEGVLVYRFTFPGRTARIALVASTECWDFERHHRGSGRGASAVEASRDGVVWVTLADDIRQRRWGGTWNLSGNLPTDLTGTEELWLRVRLLTEHAEPKAGYTVAQFCRSVPAEGQTVFSIEADCIPIGTEP